jgi:UDP-N-acetylmuramoyl-tripeptide--D-alanyl-D-alanine ligase
MSDLSIAEIIAISNGTPHQLADLNFKPTTAIYNSKDAVAGSLFAAFKGAHHDGHDFVDQAIANGAALAIVSRPVSAPCIVVPDVLKTLTDLATANRLKLAIPVLALTGSSGKTTTKDLLIDITSSLGPAVATIGSKNNELGLPSTLFAADRNTAVMVLEMGARHVGNIRDLCDIAKPNIVGITNIGSAHLGEFGSLQRLIDTKSEILQNLQSKDIAVLNADQEVSYQMAKKTSANILFAGTAANADIQIVNLKLDEWAHPHFDLLTPKGKISIALNLIGEHQANNAAIAAAMAIAAGVELADIEAGLNSAQPRSSMRLAVSKIAGVVVLDDSYNANPESMTAAIKVLHTYGSTARKILVVGEMGELGPDAAQFHAQIGNQAATAGVSVFVCVGALAKFAATAARESGMSQEQVLWFENNQQARELLRHEIGSGDVLLFKASRAGRFDQLVSEVISDLTEQRG